MGKFIHSEFVRNEWWRKIWLLVLQLLPAAEYTAAAAAAAEYGCQQGCEIYQWITSIIGVSNIVARKLFRVANCNNVFFIIRRAQKYRKFVRIRFIINI